MTWRADHFTRVLLDGFGSTAKDGPVSTLTDIDEHAAAWAAFEQRQAALNITRIARRLGGTPQDTRTVLEALGIDWAEVRHATRPADRGQAHPWTPPTPTVDYRPAGLTAPSPPPPAEPPAPRPPAKPKPKACVKTPGKPPPAPRRFDRARMLALYNTPMTAKAVAHELGVHPHSVLRALKQEGAQPERRGRPLNDQDVINRYAQDKSVHKIAAHYGVSTKRIRRILDTHGVQRPRQGSNTGKAINTAEVIRLYRIRRSVRLVAATMHLGRDRVAQALRDAGEMR